MRINFMLTSPSGRLVLARGAEPTRELVVHDWTNQSLVTRMARASGVPAQLGQMLITWVWHDPR